MTPARTRSRSVRSVLLVDERIERLQRIEQALSAAGLEVHACARFEQAFYVTDEPTDVLLVASDAAGRAGWSQAHTLRVGGNGRIAALAYGDAEETEDAPTPPRTGPAHAADAARAGFGWLDLAWRDPERLAASLRASVVRAAPLVWVLSAEEYPGDREWADAVRRAGYDLRWMRGGDEADGGGRPWAVVLRDDPWTAGRGRPNEELRELARDSRLVILGREADAERRRAWRELGAAAYVEEPFHVDVLLGQLDPAAERRPGAAATVSRETATGVLWIGLDRGGRIVEWNAAAAEFLAGPGASEVLPLGELNWFDLVCAAAAREQCREQLDALARDPATTSTGEWPVSAHDGEVQWLHWTCRCTTDVDEGQAAFVLVGVSDGLWRRWSRGDFLAAVSGADRCGDTLLLLEQQHGRVLFAGSRALSWWGVGRDELTNTSRWWDRIAASDHAPLRSAIDRARRGRAVRCGFELEVGDGVSRLVQARLFLVRPDERTNAVIAVLLSEIGEEPARPTEREHEAVTIVSLLTAAPVVPFVIDARGHLTLADVDLASELGLIDAQGRELELDVRAELPALTERLQEAFDGRGFGVPLELDGRHVELSLWPRFDADGEVVQVGGVAVDTSDGRRVREALRSLVDVTAPITGRAFFRDLALALTRALGVRMAYLAARRAPDDTALGLVSCWSAGEFVEGSIELDEERPEWTVLEAGTLFLGRREAEARCVGFPFDRGFGAASPDRARPQGWVGVPVRDSVGEVVGVLALVHDRPLESSLVEHGFLDLLAARAGSELERLASERTLERSRTRWRSLVGNMPDRVTTITAQGTVTFSNGFIDEGESLFAACAPEHRAEFEACVREVVRTHASSSLEHRATDRSARTSWLHSRIGALPVESGEDDEVVVISTDISARKDQEERDRFRGRMETLVTEISTRFVDTGSDDLEALVAEAVERIGEASGADRAYLFDLVGESLVLRHAWTREGCAAVPERIAVEPATDGARRTRGLGFLVEAVAQGEEVLASDVDELDGVELGTGARLGLRSLVSVPVTSGDGVRGFLGFDTAYRRLDWDRAVVALLRLMADLFASVSERARVEAERATLEEQLRQVEKLDAIGTLAGGVAHDFNNLLTGIQGQAELLLRVLDDPQSRRAADTIATTARRGAKLTRQLLNFARCDESEATAVEVEAVVREVVDLLERTLGKLVEVRTDFRAEGATVIGDHTLLQQVVLNLAINAKDAMPDGGTLSFGTSRTRIRSDEAHLFPDLEPGEYASVFVADTGEGIDPANLEKIFDPFFTTKAPGKGTGLGLAQVFGIVRKHGGRVDVNSRLGEGTTFQLLLPLASERQAVEAAVEPPSEALRGTGRLLVVDDEAVVRETLVAMATELGYEVDGVERATEALGLLTTPEHGYDAVLVDLRMPELDGVGFLERLRASGERIPAVLCSGGGYERFTARLSELDLAGFLHKPFELVELSKVLDQVVGASRGSGGVEGEGVDGPPAARPSAPPARAPRDHT